MFSRSVVSDCDPMDCSPPGSSVPGDSPGKNTGVGCHALLQGIFPTQGSNPDLLNCGQFLYHLSHQGSPKMLEWVAYPFSRGPSWPRNQTRVSCIAGRFLISWATREDPKAFIELQFWNNFILSGKEVLKIRQTLPMYNTKIPQILLFYHICFIILISIDIIFIFWNTWK